MKTHYSWETEEEAEWPDDPQPSPMNRSRVGVKRMLLGLVLMTAVAFVALFVYFDHRLESREEIVRQGVLAAHRTWEQAVAREDLELFTSLLGREDTGWYHSQRRLLMAGRVSSRDAFGLSLVPAPDGSPLVELDANWRHAEVIFPQQYAIDVPGEQTQTIHLLHTQLYQVHGESWQVAPLDEYFWGGGRIHETERLVVSYPHRDEALVQRIAAELDSEIDAVCRPHPDARECSADWRTLVIFDTAPESLLLLNDPSTPAMRGRAFILPAPSLVGLPADDAAYRALYNGYTGRILSTLYNNLDLPVPYPEQEIAALCFPSVGEGLRLFTHNPAAGVWAEQVTERRYSVLQPLPDDSGLIMRAGFPGVEMAHLELVLRRDGEETLLFDEGTTEQSARLLDISTRPQRESLVLSAVQGSTGLTSYRSLSLDSCLNGACEVVDMPGYPLWSSDGRRSLVLVGSELHLGDSNGSPERLIDRAFSPFWVTDDTFGYVRLLGNAADETPEMELVLQSAATGETWSIIKSADLLRHIAPDLSGTLRIMHATANRNDPQTIFLAGTPVVGGSGRFYVVALHLDGVLGSTSTLTLTQAEVLLTLDDLPVGDRSRLTPTGYSPFTITPDGRWLTVVRFVDPVTSTWEVYIRDIERGETQTRTLNYPDYPAPTPFYDWSADSNWLVLIDDGFLRLLAPTYNYERVITHEFAACRYPAWINP